MSAVNPIARLQATNPEMEIWFDSSPLVFEDWLKATLPTIPSAAELFKLEPAPTGGVRFAVGSLLQGVTTNQPLTWQVLEKHPAPWRAWLEAEARKTPGLPVQEAMWRLFIEIAARGAAMVWPLADANRFRCGQICCQVDPRDMTNLDAMLVQARRIHAAAPNIMVKLPGTKEGVDAVRILAAEGVPTNVTLGFTVPQLVAVGEAAKAGLVEAHRRGTNLRYWRSCAGMMLGRYEDHPLLQAQAKERGITLSVADLRWAGIAIFRKAHQLYRERGYPTKLMAASMRVGPTVDGVMRVWHLEKLAGANAVLTVFPNILEGFLMTYGTAPLPSQIDAPIPADVMERLMRIPYFSEAYDEGGMTPEQFVAHPALQVTAASFAESMVKIEAFAADVLKGTKV